MGSNISAGSDPASISPGAPAQTASKASRLGVINSPPRMRRRFGDRWLRARFAWQVLLTSLCLLLSYAAAAQTAPQSTAATPQLSYPLVTLPRTPHWVFSLTVFPFQIVMPLSRMGYVFPVELTGEVRATDKIGIAFIAGAGRRTDTDTTDGFTIVDLGLDAGLEARYYLLGDFSGGLILGWKLYLWDLVEVTTLAQNGSTTGAENRGLTTGPVVGYKHIWPVGFTVNALIGYGHIFYTKGYVFDEPSGTVLLDLKVGWSF
jgi:hypothetical protein